jgi:Gas vesicle synthesis protein GvpL/GvpF
MAEWLQGYGKCRSPGRIRSAWLLIAPGGAFAVAIYITLGSVAASAMPILLYCIAKRVAVVNSSIAGVAGIPVLRREAGPLAVFASSNGDPEIWLRAELRASALEYHRVLREVFAATAIVPFRFPTIFASEEELTKHLEQQSEHYHRWLEQFAQVVQMEIRISHSDFPPSTASGADYLKQRQQAARMVEDFGAELKTRLSRLAKEWRERPSKHGIRAFALVERDGIAKFHSAIRDSFIPEGLQVRVSGPWPAGEFMEPS